jgi:hypothetical protein
MVRKKKKIKIRTIKSYGSAAKKKMKIRTIKSYGSAAKVKDKNIFRS